MTRKLMTVVGVVFVAWLAGQLFAPKIVAVRDTGRLTSLPKRCGANGAVYTRGAVARIRGRVGTCEEDGQWSYKK